MIKTVEIINLDCHRQWCKMYDCIANRDCSSGCRLICSLSIHIHIKHKHWGFKQKDQTAGHRNTQKENNWVLGQSCMNWCNIKIKLSKWWGKKEQLWATATTLSVKRGAACLLVPVELKLSFIDDFTADRNNEWSSKYNIKQNFSVGKATKAFQKSWSV